MGILNNASSYLNTPTYDGSGQTVHVSVIDFKTEFGLDSWGGYRYWMGNSPLPGGADNYEDPSILVSNDNITWIPHPSFPNPVGEHPSNYVLGDIYNSDPELIYNPDEDCLFLYWRFVRDAPPNANDPTYYDDTRYGVDIKLIKLYQDGTKSAETVLFSSTWGENVLSPTVVYETTGKWHMWYRIWRTFELGYRSSIDGINWSEMHITSHIINDGCIGGDIWHVKAQLNKWEKRFEFMVQGTGTVPFAHAYADVTNPMVVVYDLPDYIISPSTTYNKWDSSYLYRGSFLIQRNTNSYFYRVWYSGSLNGAWHIGYTEGTLRTSFSNDIQCSADTQISVFNSIQCSADTSITAVQQYPLSSTISSSSQILGIMSLIQRYPLSANLSSISSLSLNIAVKQLIPLVANISGVSSITANLIQGSVTQIPLNVNINGISLLSANLSQIVITQIPLMTNIIGTSLISANLNVLQSIPLALNITNTSLVRGVLSYLDTSIIPIQLSTNIITTSRIIGNLSILIPLTSTIGNISRIIAYLRDGGQHPGPNYYWVELKDMYYWKGDGELTYLIGEEKPCGGSVLSEDEQDQFTITSATYQLFDKKGNVLLSGVATVRGGKVRAQLKATEGMYGFNIPLVFTCNITPGDPQELPQVREFVDYINVKKAG